MMGRSAFTLALLCLSATVQAQVWSDRGPASSADTPSVRDGAARAVVLDRPAMEALLSAAPLEARPGDVSRGVAVPLPRPEGGVEAFRVVEAPILAPALQARYPELRTFLGQSAERPATSVRLSLTPRGLSAMTLGPGGRVLVDPLGDGARHVVYRGEDAAPRPRAADVVLGEAAAPRAADDGGGLANGETLRTYRLALAATAEYTAFHGGTRAEGLAAAAVTLNRVVGLYERELAIRLELVAGTDSLFYTDPATDPYTNTSGPTMLGQNQATIDAVIGDDGYDIGHVFSTGGGGVAQLASVCGTGSKARGVTGLARPVGDVFDVDYVAHEIGHQFGATHTFNGTDGACDGANRTAANAFEPGSGSTIMAYAGICGAHNIATRSSPYFHWASLTEITRFTAGQGGTCGRAEPTGNDVPTPTLAARTATLPIGTPFRLIGGATDATPDALTFAWEELDLGPGGPPPGASGWDNTAPFFRSFEPTAEPARTFPSPARYYRGLKPVTGERLPTRARFLNMMLTVRDNAPGGGAVADTSMLVRIVGDAGPFAVLSPAEGDLYGPGSIFRLEWDPANTGVLRADGTPDADGVDVETVEVAVSFDRGQTFTVLESGVPNVGLHTMRLPDALGEQVVLRVESETEGARFFAASGAFAIRAGVSTAAVPAPGALALGAVHPNPARGAAATVLSVDRAQAVRVSLVDALGRRVRTLFDGDVLPGAPRRIEIPARGLAEGVYLVRAEGEAGVATRRATIVR